MELPKKLILINIVLLFCIGWGAMDTFVFKKYSQIWFFITLIIWVIFNVCEFCELLEKCKKGDKK